MSTGDESETLLKPNLAGLPGSMAAILEMSFDAVIGFDARERITYWNPAAEQMYGWTAQEALGKTPAKLFWPVNTPEEKKSRSQRQSKLKKGETLRGEHTSCRKDGASLRVQYTARAVFNAEGKVTGYLAIYRDLSAEVQALEKSREKEESLRARMEEIETLLAVSPVAIFVAHDPECVHITGNPAGYRMVEVPDEANISKSAPAQERPTYRTFRDGLEVPARDLPMQKAARLGVEVSEDELELRFEDGSQKFLYAFAKPLFDSQGRSRGAVAAMLDITERKRSEQLIRESEERFRNIFNQSPIGIGVYDADGVLVNLNQASMEMFGIPGLESVLGLKLFSSPTVHAEARMKLRDQEQIQEEVVYDFDEIRRLGFYETTKSGVSYFSRIITPLHSTSGDEPFGYLSQVLDITARKRAEEQLERSNQKLNDILASIQDDFYVIDRDWIFVYANRQFTSKLGKEPEDLIGNNVWKMFPKHVGMILEENFRAAMEKREIRRFEMPGQYTDAWYKITVFPSPEGITVLGSDITERKRAEQALAQAMQELQGHINNSPLAIVSFDPEYRIIEWSAGAERMFGWRADEVLNKTITDLRWVHEDDAQHVASLSADMFAGRTSSNVHANRNYRKDGSVIECEWYNSALLDASGKLVSILSQVLDVTERRRAEEALRASEERLRQMIETSLVAVGLGDSTGRIFKANGAFYRLTGYSREEIQAGQLGWNQLTAPEYAEIDRQMIATLVTTGSAGPYEKEYIRKDGSRVPLLLTMSKLPDRDEHIAFLMDITERKRAEETLARQSELLQRIFENIPVLLVMWDPRLRKFTLNRHAEIVLGWTTADANNGDFMSMIYPDPVYRAEVSTYMQSLASGFREWVNVARDGERIPIEWANIRLADDTMIGIGVDLREHKRDEAALRENQKQLQLLNETLEQKVQEKTAEVRQLASDLVKAVQRERHRLSHILHDDLQQRIYAIRIQLTFLHDELQRENEGARREVSDIEKQLAEALEVTRNLSIDLSPPILRDEGLSHAIKWLAARMGQRYGLPIELQADGVFALADEELHVLLFNCVRELLFNVVKHAQASQAVVTLQWSETDLRIEVHDDGKGFQVAAPVQPVNGEMSEDNGVQSSSGLSTIRHQLSLFGGRTEIRSEPGAGTQIILIVPVTEGDQKNVVTG